MNSSKKLTLTITLNAWEERLIKRALEILSSGDTFGGEFSGRRGFRRVLRMALWSYTRAVISAGSSPIYPVAASLRFETAEEMQDRIDKNVPGESTSASDWQMPGNRWN